MNVLVESRAEIVRVHVTRHRLVDPPLGSLLPNPRVATGARSKELSAANSEPRARDFHDTPPKRNVQIAEEPQ